MAAVQEESASKFHASKLAEWFHSAPHKDFNLEGTTTIFSPSENAYREALYILAIFITSFGALLFLLIVMYFTCCYCLCRKNKELRDDSSYRCKKSCLQKSVFIFALIMCAALITGFIYNGKTSDGVDEFRNSVDDIKENINLAGKMGAEIKTTLEQARSNIGEIPDTDVAYDLTTKAIVTLAAVNNLLPEDVVNEGSDVGDKLNQYDNYRWLTIVILMSWCILLCIFLFWLGCQLNSCILVTASGFCLLTILFTWAATGAEFAIATGIGDFCVHPKQAIEKIKKGNATAIVISYYMDCGKFNPFSANLSGIHDTLNNVIRLIQDISGHEELKRLILQDLYRVNNSLALYEANFTCEEIHQEYIDAMNALCGKTLNSLAIIILAVLIIAFLSGLLSCCVCPLWRYRRANPTTYNDIRRSSSSDVGNAVLWWPHDIDAQSDHSFYQRHAEPTEQSPLITNQAQPNYESGNQPNVNFIHVDHHPPAGRTDERFQTGSRHSF